jgi:AcrR family transcriptional regulator
MTSPFAQDSVRRRAPDERPQQILDAALEIFDEQGLDRARLDDIARRAGIAKGTIYLYFPNKEELFREVVRYTIVSRLETVRVALASGENDRSAVDELCQYMREWWDFLRTPAALAVYRLVIGELHRFPELMTFYLEEVVVPARALVTGIIDRGIARGDFRPVDSVGAARILGATFVTHALWLCKQPAAAALGSVTPDQIFDQVCDFALHALRPASPGGLTTE